MRCSRRRGGCNDDLVHLVSVRRFDDLAAVLGEPRGQASGLHRFDVVVCVRLRGELGRGRSVRVERGVLLVGDPSLRHPALPFLHLALLFFFEAATPLVIKSTRAGFLTASMVVMVVVLALLLVAPGAEPALSTRSSSSSRRGQRPFLWVFGLFFRARRLVGGS